MVLALLFACSSDPASTTPAQVDGAPATFADASDDELLAAARSGLGLGTLYAYLEAFSIDADATDHILQADKPHCPDVSFEAPSALTYTADGCVGSQTGNIYVGVLLLDNVPTSLTTVADYFGDYEADEDAEMRVQFTDWTSETAGEDTWVDGGWSQSSYGTSGPYSNLTDLWVGLPGAPAFRTQAAYDCVTDDAGTRCDAAVGQLGEVEGLGTFLVDASGVEFVDGAYAGTLVLGGLDDLRFDLDGVDDEGCLPATIGGESRTVCIPDLAADAPVDQPDEEEDPVEVIVGQGLGGDASAVTVDVGTTPEVAVVEVDLGNTDMDNAEVHPLTLTEDGETRLWGLTLAVGSYDPGVSTTLDLVDDIDHAAMRVRAYDAGGALLACAYQGWADEAEAEAFFGDAGCPD